VEESKVPDHLIDEARKIVDNYKNTPGQDIVIGPDLGGVDELP